MVDQVIQLLIYVLMFAIAAYGLYWVCVKSKLPDPAFWICGVVLLIVILLFVSGRLGSVGPFPAHR